MKRPFNRRLFWLAVGIVSVAEALVLCLAFQRKNVSPSGEVGETYTRYADVGGIDVSYIKDFKINDSVFVDVTLIEASDSAAWVLLKEDFRIVEPWERGIPYDSTMVLTWLAPHNDHSSPMDTVLLNNDIILVRFATKTVVVIDVESEEQIKAVNRYHIDNIHNKTQKNEQENFIHRTARSDRHRGHGLPERNISQSTIFHCG